MRSLVWFRRDLRIADNPALYHACRNSENGVIGCFVLTPKQWRQHNDADCKVQFWLENLSELSKQLGKLRIPFILKTCDWFDEVPTAIATLATQHKCSKLFFNCEYEVNERQRDNGVERACAEKAIEVIQFHDRVIVPPEKISTQDGRFYSVFTPYKKAWNTIACDYAEILEKPPKQKNLDIVSSDVPHRIPNFDFSNYREDLWKPGEPEAQRRLQVFTRKISAYNQNRDQPSISGTSLLSPYLAAGVVSPRQCFTAAMPANRGKIQGDEGPTTWISELTWRDFYTHVLVGFPRVSMNQPFKQKTKHLEWRDSQQDFEAWAEGKTGYPIVDAGMRQLNQTGWMHNRLRMVTAMFLSKHLLIDWRRGEEYFMRKLIDGDLAANNGGWQWSASTGTDSVPYFRIFNPFSQSKRFDSEGKFIKKFCPELDNVSSSSLHDSDKLSKAIKDLKLDYPGFMVDHKTARDRALQAFKSLD